LARGRAARRGLRGPRLLERLAARQAIAEEAGPFRSDLLVQAIEDKDKHSLERSDDSEENKEDGDDDVLRHEEHQIAEDPREADRDEDREVDPELLLAIALVRLGGSRERLVDLADDEEEEDGVRADDEQAWDEERQEARQIVRDPALRAASIRDGSIFLRCTDTDAKA